LVFFNNDKTVFRQLVSFLTPKPMKIGWGWFFCRVQRNFS